MDYKSNSRDDPMGFALLGDGSFQAPKVDVWHGWPSEGECKTEGAECDAMGGKGG